MPKKRLTNPNNICVTIAVTIDLKDRLDKIVEKHDSTSSKLLRPLIEQWIEEEERKLMIKAR